MGRMGEAIWGFSDRVDPLAAAHGDQLLDILHVEQPDGFLDRCITSAA
jgi:hypothetical protein